MSYLRHGVQETLQRATPFERVALSTARGRSPRFSLRALRALKEMVMLEPGTKIVVIKNPYVPTGSIGEVTLGDRLSPAARRMGCMARVVDSNNRRYHNFFRYDEIKALDSER